jgi:hypothetical protein
MAMKSRQDKPINWEEERHRVRCLGKSSLAQTGQKLLVHSALTKHMKLTGVWVDEYFSEIRDMLTGSEEPSDED